MRLNCDGHRRAKNKEPNDDLVGADRWDPRKDFCEVTFCQFSGTNMCRVGGYIPGPGSQKDELEPCRRYHIFRTTQTIGQHGLLMSEGCVALFAAKS
jgi:hypothetical protein